MNTDIGGASSARPKLYLTTNERSGANGTHSVFAPVFTALRRGESLRRDNPPASPAHSAGGKPESGAKATALQTLTRPPGIFASREAFGLRRVHRRFSPGRPSQTGFRKRVPFRPAFARPGRDKPTIARRFNAGSSSAPARVPPGRLKFISTKTGRRIRYGIFSRPCGTLAIPNLSRH